MTRTTHDLMQEIYERLPNIAIDAGPFLEHQHVNDFDEKQETLKKLAETNNLKDIQIEISDERFTLELYESYKRKIDAQKLKVLVRSIWKAEERKVVLYFYHREQDEMKLHLLL